MQYRNSVCNYITSVDLVVELPYEWANAITRTPSIISARESFCVISISLEPSSFHQKIQWSSTLDLTSVVYCFEFFLLLNYSFIICNSIYAIHQVETLLDIWRDCRRTVRPKPKPRLPEPPAQRDLLKAEIKFFIDSIHEKAKANGR